MRLTLQKRLSASVLGCSVKRVIFDPSRLEDVKEAITKTDIRMLVGEGVIKAKPKKGVSRARANKRMVQKRKGLRKGEGRRKGKMTAREPKKEAWMKKIRAQRKFIGHLRETNLIKPETFKELYRKSKGGFFRSINHIRLYITEHKLLLKRAKGETGKTKTKKTGRPVRKPQKIEKQTMSEPKKKLKKESKMIMGAKQASKSPNPKKK